MCADAKPGDIRCAEYGRVRFALTALTALATLALASPAAAIEYPWCAQYGDEDGGGRNCGFVSRENACEPNLFYKGATERPPGRRAGTIEAD